MLRDKEIGYILHKAAMISKNNLTCNFNPYGITPGQFIVLKEILYNNERTSELGLSPACIAERLDWDRPTVSGIIDRLETQGWILRLPNLDDKRSFLVQLTDKAAETLRTLDGIRKENHNMILNGFTEEEIALFKGYLSRVIDNFKRNEEHISN